MPSEVSALCRAASWAGLAEGERELLEGADITGGRVHGTDGGRGAVGDAGCGRKILYQLVQVWNVSRSDDAEKLGFTRSLDRSRPLRSRHSHSIYISAHQTLCTRDPDTVDMETR